MRPTLLTAAAALALAACTDAGGPEAEGMGDEAAVDTSAAGTTGSDMTSDDPDTPVSNTPAPQATATTARTARDADSNPPGDACGASQVAAFVAQQATSAVRRQVAAKVGHDRIRWIGPDTAVTEDYSPQRLNVSLDRNDVITGARCG
jgi:hypothetical protein